MVHYAIFEHQLWKDNLNSRMDKSKIALVHVNTGRSQYLLNELIPLELHMVVIYCNQRRMLTENSARAEK